MVGEESAGARSAAALAPENPARMRPLRATYRLSRHSTFAEDWLHRQTLQPTAKPAAHFSAPTSPALLNGCGDMRTVYSNILIYVEVENRCIQLSTAAARIQSVYQLPRCCCCRRSRGWCAAPAMPVVAACTGGTGTPSDFLAVKISRMSVTYQLDRAAGHTKPPVSPSSTASLLLPPRAKPLPQQGPRRSQPYLYDIPGLR
jgi:hypothetical protein